MLLNPSQSNFTDNLNNKNMSLSPQHHRHHHHDDNSLNTQLTEQLLTGTPKCYSTRPGHRSRLPPHIQICPPGHTSTMMSCYPKSEALDNDAFHTQLSMTSLPSTTLSTSDEKQEVHSGSLYIIRHTGSSSSSSSPTWSPSRSSSRSSTTSFHFRTSPPTSTNQWSPQGSPASSPKLRSTQKMPVFVRVYRCNHDHFAVITRDVLYSNKPVYLNLRHSRIIPGNCLGRFIVAGKNDSGQVTEFEAPDLDSLGQWLDAFQSNTPPASPNRNIYGNSGGGVSAGTPPIPKTPTLPTVTETDEDD